MNEKRLSLLAPIILQSQLCATSHVNDFRAIDKQTIKMIDVKELLLIKELTNFSDY